MSLDKADEYELPDEIDFSKWKRIPNPFFQKFEELNLVSLDFDVAAKFPDSVAVNAALRGLMAESEKANAAKLKKAS